MPVDPKFLEVCEPNSIAVCGCVPADPVLVGAIVDGPVVCIRFAEENPARAIRLTLRLTGIRKGFAGVRFPDRSQAQFDANERFIKSAYANE